jgi:hypothetical protein
MLQPLRHEHAIYLIGKGTLVDLWDSPTEYVMVLCICAYSGSFADAQRSVTGVCEL